MKIVPDTSVIVDGRVTVLVSKGEEFEGADIVIPEAVVAELEGQANRGLESGENGLDEIAKLQELAATGNISISFMGERPSYREIESAQLGAVDARIRDLAESASAVLFTSDRVQARVAKAKGISVRYIEPLMEEPKDLEILRYFDEHTMSVHLKTNCTPFVKKGTPGEMRLEHLNEEGMTETRLEEIAKEIVEAAKRDHSSFIEIERRGATVVQLRNMRICIAKPPFSDGMEITAVRPVTKLAIGDYNLPEDVVKRLSDYHRGVFVSGPPGSGKSTFAQAVADYLHSKNAVVKTMESPRDLQVEEEITQYAPLENEMELTGDILLLVRPDFVVYDEVRKTRDFEVFADMRLAGVGLVGVTHANRAIDAVQRLIGRVELGMIPQVVDTVIHIVKGEIQQILEMSFTVRVPAGMTEADLARPIIAVKDFSTKEDLYEIYTYGEQVVVMPISEAAGGKGAKKSGAERLAEGQVLDIVRHYVYGDVDVQMTSGNSARVAVDDDEIARIIGRNGSTIKRLEEETGLSIDVVALSSAPKTRRMSESKKRDLIPIMRRSKKNIILVLEPEYAGRDAEVFVEGEPLLAGTISGRGELRIKSESTQGKLIAKTTARGGDVRVRV